MTMMGYYGYDMMGWGAGWLFGGILYLEIVIIGALLIAWLWKQLKK